MARTKQTARRSVKPVITWTRFHLPREQKYPTWSVDQTGDGLNVHLGPLSRFPGMNGVRLGRMVDNPEHAAYIIAWATPDDLKEFQSSPACVEFLQNLPEYHDSQSSVESGPALRSLTLSEASSSSSSTVSTRFLLYKHLDLRPTGEVEGRVTLTAFLIPRKSEDRLACTLWEEFESVFSNFEPPGYESLTFSGRSRYMYKDAWFKVLSEDTWVEKSFGKLEETGDDDQGGRTIFIHFQLWPSQWGGTPELEAASAADPEAMEAWNRVIARVMPPATTWAQERWDIQKVHQFFRMPEAEESQQRRYYRMMKAEGYEPAEEVGKKFDGCENEDESGGENQYGSGCRNRHGAGM